MPLNMNTVGTGNGCGGSGQSGKSSLFELSDISSRLHSSVNMKSIESITIGTKAYSKTSGSSGSDLTYPMIKFKGYYYGVSNANIIGKATETNLYRYEITDDGNTANVVATLISGPYKSISDMFVHGNYLYMVIDTTYSYISSSNIAEEQLYRFDGTTFTKVTEKFSKISGIYSSSSGALWKLTPVTHCPDDGFYFLLGSGSSSAGSGSSFTLSPKIGICKVDEISGFSKLCTSSLPYLSWSYNGAGYLGVSATAQISYKLAYFVPYNAFTEFGDFPHILSITIEDSLITLYISHLFKGNADSSSSGSVDMYNYIYKVEFKYDPIGTWNATFTSVSENLITTYNVTKTPSGGWVRGDYCQFWSYPLSFDVKDTYLIVSQPNQYINENGNATDTGSGTTELYLMKLFSETVSIQRITMTQNAYSIIGRTYPMSLMFDFNTSHPFMWIFYENSSDYTYNYMRYLTGNGMDYTSDSSVCEFSSYFEKGDICYCNAGILSYTKDGNTVSVDHSNTFKITESGSYTFVTNVYDAYKTPEFIVQTSDGHLLNLRVRKINDTDISCYVTKGMKVNDIDVQSNGYNQFSNVLSTGRVRISMK